MQVKTTRFGEIEVSEDSVLHMPEGMLGFNSFKRYVLLEDKPDTPFKWMQSLDNSDLAFIVVNPIEFFPDYGFELNDYDAESLEIEDPSNAAILTTVSLDRNEGRMTTNLLGPVVINSENLKAKQVVIDDERYGTKHLIGWKTETELVFETAAA